MRGHSARPRAAEHNPLRTVFHFSCVFWNGLPLFALVVPRVSVLLGFLPLLGFPLRPPDLLVPFFVVLHPDPVAAVVELSALPGVFLVDLG